MIIFIIGSTCHTAIGMRTIAEMKTHFRRYVHEDSSNANISLAVQERMQYGTVNEVCAQNK